MLRYLYGCDRGTRLSIHAKFELELVAQFRDLIERYPPPRNNVDIYLLAGRSCAGRPPCDALRGVRLALLQH